VPPEEGRHRCRGHAQIVTKLAGDFGTDRECHDRTSLFACDARDGLKHCRLARAGDTLNANHAILGFQHETGSCLLFGRQPSQAHFAGDLLHLGSDEIGDQRCGLIFALGPQGNHFALQLHCSSCGHHRAIAISE